MSDRPLNPFKGRHYSGEVILLAVRWYLRYPLAYQHVAEMLAERGLAVGCELHLALGTGVCGRAEQTLPAASAAHEQIVPDRRDLYKDQGRGPIPVSCAGLDRPDHRISFDGEAGCGCRQTLSVEGHDSIGQRDATGHECR